MSTRESVVRRERAAVVFGERHVTYVRLLRKIPHSIVGRGGPCKCSESDPKCGAVFLGCNRTDSGAPRVKILKVGCPQPGGNTVKFSHENSSKSSPSQESEPSVRGCV